MDNTVNLVSKLKMLMNQFIISELEKHKIEGIVPSHGDIIASLFKKESLTMSELSRQIEKDPSTVTTLVKKLSKIGYIQLLKDPEDKRIINVSLTSKGKSLKPAFTSISKKIYEKQYRDISEDKKDIFREVLQKMIQNFS